MNPSCGWSIDDGRNTGSSCDEVSEFAISFSVFPGHFKVPIRSINGLQRRPNCIALLRGYNGGHGPSNCRLQRSSRTQGLTGQIMVETIQASAELGQTKALKAFRKQIQSNRSR
jgi:hypothetical protein